MIRLAVVRNGRVPRPDRDRQAGSASCSQNGPRRLRATAASSGSATSEVPEHRLDERQRLPDWRNAADDAVVLAVAQGIRSTDPRHIHTVELNYLGQQLARRRPWRPLIELDAAYTYYADLRGGAQGVQPAARHAGLHGRGRLRVRAEHVVDLARRRRTRCGARSTGRCSAARRASSTATTTPGRSAGLEEPPRHARQRADRLPRRSSSRGRPWFRLVPDQSTRCLTSGYGTFSRERQRRVERLRDRGRTPDGKLAIAYLPTGPHGDDRHVEARRQAGCAVVRPERRDLRSCRPASQNGTTQTFRPPDQNRDGDGDWVLVLTAGSR